MASGITSFPAFMVLALALCDFHKSCRMKLPCTAKCLQVMYSVLIPFRVYHDVVFSALSKPKLGLAHSCPGFRTTLAPFVSYCHAAFCFLARFFVDASKPMPLKLFRSHLATTIRCRPTQSRASNTSNVETMAPEGAKFREIVLLTGGQQFRDKHEFQDFKGEGISAVFVPGALKRDAVVNIATQILEMFIAARAQIHGATDVDFAGGSASNAVDTRCVGDRRSVHALNCLSFSALFSCCQGARLHLFARGNYSLTRQLPDNTFFHTACKAEV